MYRLFIILAAITFTAGSCTNKTGSASNTDTTNATASNAGAATDMREKNKTTALDAEQAVSNHDPEALFKNTSPDFTDYGDGSTPPVKGRDSSKVFFQQFLTAFPDIKGENLMALADGDHVAVFGDWSGTFKGQIMGMKPTNKSFKIKDVDLFTFNDQGQITEHRSIQPMTTILMQVGASMKK